MGREGRVRRERRRLLASTVLSGVLPKAPQAAQKGHLAKLRAAGAEGTSVLDSPNFYLAAAKLVDAFVVLNLVNPRAAVESVVAEKSIRKVVVLIAEQEVVAGAPVYIVVAEVTENVVVALKAAHEIVAVCARHTVVVLGS
jgi:hypothetical protein